VIIESFVLETINTIQPSNLLVPGKSEIGNLNARVHTRHQDICGLEVPVDHVGLVDEANRIKHLIQHVLHVLGGEELVRLDDLL